MDDRATLGQWGERRAWRFLRQCGYKRVTRNYRCPAGEIDLIVLDGEEIVFVEVKTRSHDLHESAEEFIPPAKRRHLHNAARFFLRQTGSEQRPCRFDVLVLVVNDQREVSIEHVTDAFTPVR